MKLKISLVHRYEVLRSNGDLFQENISTFELSAGRSKSSILVRKPPLHLGVTYVVAAKLDLLCQLKAYRYYVVLSE